MSTVEEAATTGSAGVQALEDYVKRAVATGLSRRYLLLTMVWRLPSRLFR
jgi:hypothetical protein